MCLETGREQRLQGFARMAAGEMPAEMSAVLADPPILISRSLTVSRQRRGVPAHTSQLRGCPAASRRHDAAAQPFGPEAVAAESPGKAGAIEVAHGAILRLNT